MSKVRILLADDHETVREGLKAIFNAQPDLEVVGEAENGDAAVAKTAQLHPDLIVMDISMARLDGLRATGEVMSRWPGCKIVVLTRHADAGYVRELLRSDAAGYVLKQSRTDQLLEAIRVVAGGATYVDPVIRETIDRLACAPASSSNGTALSRREEQVLKLTARGYSNKEIAGRLELSVKTIETHKSRAMQKLGLTGRSAVMRLALSRGWLPDS